MRDRRRPNLTDLIKQDESKRFFVNKIDETIGYGVFCKEQVVKHEFLLEYKGEKINETEADERAEVYGKTGKGNFIYHGIKDIHGKLICIDATKDMGYGKLVNDSPWHAANAKMKRMVINSEVHLCLFATTDIEKGTEIRYDYGDNEEALSWRKETIYLYPRAAIDKKEENTVGQTEVDGICFGKEQKIALKQYKKRAIDEEDRQFKVGSENDDMTFSDNETEIPYFLIPIPSKPNASSISKNENHTLGSLRKLYTGSMESNDLHDEIDPTGDPEHIQSTPVKNQNTEIAKKELEKVLKEDDACVAENSAENIDFHLDEMITPVNDSGMVVEDLEIVETDEEIHVENDQESIVDSMKEKSNDADDNQKSIVVPIKEKSKDVDNENGEIKNVNSKSYVKPARICTFCDKPQSRLKRHILSKHKDHPDVAPLLKLSKKEQDHHIERFRKDGIRKFNIKSINEGRGEFQRERKSSEAGDPPVMCSGCFGFFSAKYKARHQQICPANKKNLMLPLVAISEIRTFENFSEDFNELLGSVRLDNVGNYLKTDSVILMIGCRSFEALKRKKDKKRETVRSVRARMRLTARVYLSFQDIYVKQDEIKLVDMNNNASDMYRRETISILGKAINTICEKTSDGDEDVSNINIISQKSGLKINILNLIKLTAKFLIGYFLMRNEDQKSQKVVDFLQVLKHFEDELFGDALYDLNYRKNVKDRKPKKLANDDDIQKIIEECENIMESASLLDFDKFVSIRAATVTYLTIFNARRGGEPVRLHLHHWEEALKGEWTAQEDLPTEHNDGMIIAYQTGKGANHLVPVIFPAVTHKAMKYICHPEVRMNAGIKSENNYIFASTQNSNSHASGWHCINEILSKLDMKGTINATKNRHRVATLLAKLNVTDQERELIYNHFGHSKTMNQNVYQAAPGELQLQSTGKFLDKIHNEKKKVASSNTGTSVSSIMKERGAPREKISMEVDHDVDTKDGKMKYSLRKNIKAAEKKLHKMQIGEEEEDEESDKDEDYCLVNNNDSSDDDDYHEVDDDVPDSQENLTTVSKDIDHDDTCKHTKAHKKKKSAWCEANIRDFQSTFASYLMQQHGYPARKEMEQFGRKHGVTYLQVRTRIVNTRRINNEKQKKIAEQMNLL